MYGGGRLRLVGWRRRACRECVDWGVKVLFAAAAAGLDVNVEATLKFPGLKVQRDAKEAEFYRGLFTLNSDLGQKTFSSKAWLRNRDSKSRVVIEYLML